MFGQLPAHSVAVSVEVAITNLMLRFAVSYRIGFSWLRFGDSARAIVAGLRGWQTIRRPRFMSEGRMGYCRIGKRMALHESDQPPIGVGRNAPMAIPCPEPIFHTELLHFEPLSCTIARLFSTARRSMSERLGPSWRILARNTQTRLKSVNASTRPLASSKSPCHPFDS